MKKALLILLLAARVLAADWKDTQIFYWWNNIQPGVALTPNIIAGVAHATQSVTTTQIGDQTGILPAYCTSFVNCPTSIQNCQWINDHQNIYDDRLHDIVCRPLTNGITYIGTNYVVGQAVVWYKITTRAWVTTTLNYFVYEAQTSFADGRVVQPITMLINGPAPVAGDSGSPVFDAGGHYMGGMTAIGGGGTGVVKAIYPSDAQYGPPEAMINYGGLFNYFNPR